MTAPKYSVCITTKNDVRTIRASLESLFSQIDPSFEVVVVDGESTDGSLNILREYVGAGRIILLVKKSNVGRGRQLAFEMSTGEYVISGIDTDDTFLQKLPELLRLYHSQFEGQMLKISTPITISPRSLVEELGGWPDLDWYEDAYLWDKAKATGRFSEIQFDLVGHFVERPHGVLGRIRLAYYASYVGLDFGKKPKLSWKTEPLYWLARVVHALSRLTGSSRRVSSPG